ncbi:MAG: histidine kinase [Defluviitaleaceae bacterium]|nr:histidine kinase [Defluviitaleaceae bacterium]
MINPRFCFMIVNIAGFLLLFAHWAFTGGGVLGVFLLMFLSVMTLARWRFPKFSHAVWVDAVACIAAAILGEHSLYPLALPLFAAAYYRHYLVLMTFAFVAADFYPTAAILLGLSALSGVFLGLWEWGVSKEREKRDDTTGRFYELQSLQDELTSAMSKVEQMTAVAERTRISRDIHDNAGHDFVSAYITFQTARGLLDEADPDVLELYDAAMERLDAGAKKIRDAVHNLSGVTALGVETLQEMCGNFPTVYNIEFKAFGDTSKVPMYAWNVLEACLSESLTNVTRHSTARKVVVDLDVTSTLVRLAIKNDGASSKTTPVGSGLRNLKRRVASIGGNVSASAIGTEFRVVCVIPMKEVGDETIIGG